RARVGVPIPAAGRADEPTGDPADPARVPTRRPEALTAPRARGAWPPPRRGPRTDAAVRTGPAARRGPAAHAATTRSAPPVRAHRPRGAPRAAGGTSRPGIPRRSTPAGPARGPSAP